MENAKSRFLEFAHDIADMYNQATENIYEIPVTISYRQVIKALFSDEKKLSIEASERRQNKKDKNNDTNTDDQNEDTDDKIYPSQDKISKIDNINYFLNISHVENLIKNLLDYDELQYFDNDDLDIFKELPLPQFLSLRIATDEDQRFKFDIFYNQLRQYFNKNNPYPWISSEKLENIFMSDKKDIDIQNAMIFHYLTYLSAYNGLRYNTVETNRVISTETLETIVANNKRVIIKSDFGSGKTTLVKNFARNNRNTVFYLDAKYNFIKKQDIFVALRPEFRFWSGNKLAKTIKRFDNIKLPGITKKSLDDKDFYKKYLGNIPKDDTLIIDHISDLSIINELKSLPCNVIFVINSNMDSSGYDVIEYNFDNKEIAKNIINTVYPGLDEEKFNILYQKTGSNIFLYHLIATTHKKYAEKHKGFNFIDKLCTINNFDDYDKLFITTDGQTLNIPVSINYGNNKATSQHFEKHITNLYDNYFDDIEPRKHPSKDRTNSRQLQLLRLLCRLKYQDISYCEFKELFSEDDLFEKLENLNWIKDDKICIPDIIAHAFNRKNTIIDPQYADALNIRVNIAIELEHSSTRPVNQKLYTKIFRCLVEDIDHLNNRAKSINEEYSNTITYKSSYELYRDGDRKTKIKPDKTTTTSAEYKENLKLFLHSVLWYAYEYKESALFNEAYKFAKSEIKNNNYFDLWDLFLFAKENAKGIDYISDKLKRLKIKFINYKIDKTEVTVEKNIISLWLLLDFYSMYLADCVTKFANEYNLDKLKPTQSLYDTFDLLNFLSDGINNISSLLSIYNNEFCDKNSPSYPYLKQHYLQYKLIYHVYDNILTTVKFNKVTESYLIIRNLFSENKLSTKVNKHYLSLIYILITLDTRVKYRRYNIPNNSTNNIINDFHTAVNSAGCLPDNIKQIAVATEKLIENIKTE